MVPEPVEGCGWEETFDVGEGAVVPEPVEGCDFYPCNIRFVGFLEYFLNMTIGNGGASVVNKLNINILGNIVFYR